MFHIFYPGHVPNLMETENITEPVAQTKVWKGIFSYMQLCILMDSLCHVV